MKDKFQSESSGSNMLERNVSNDVEHSIRILNSIIVMA